MAVNREEVLSILSDHMLTKEKIEDWYHIKYSPENVLSKAPMHHVVRERDKLFWSLYIIVCGLDSYYDARDKLFTSENEFKYASIPKLREKKHILKSVKLKPQDVESELISNKPISINGLQALAIAYEKSIIFIHDRIYYDFPYGDTYFFLEKKNNEIILHLNEQSPNIANIKKELYHINHTSKSIKGVSSYTVKELQEIAFKLNITTDSDSGKPLTKPHLYNKIVIIIEKLT